MSLAKIPFILSSALAVHVVNTPPNRPPPSGERVKPTGMELIVPWVPKVINPLYWSWALLEIVVILAINYPIVSISQHLLHMLIPGDDTYVSATRIRITWPFLLGWILSVSGSLVRRSCYRLLGPMFTFDLSIRKKHRLVTSGPYSIVRHPSYVGIACAAVGVALSHLSSGSWVAECLGFSDKGWMFGWIWIAACVLSVIGLTIRMEKEDQMLRREFGSEWEQWRDKVPWRIVPGVY